jgi:hypothetical protein
MEDGSKPSLAYFGENECLHRREDLLLQGILYSRFQFRYPATLEVIFRIGDQVLPQKCIDVPSEEGRRKGFIEMDQCSVWHYSCILSAGQN